MGRHNYSQVANEEAAVEAPPSINETKCGGPSKKATFWGTSILTTSPSRALGLNVLLLQHLRDRGLQGSLVVQIGVLVGSSMISTYLCIWMNGAAAKFWASRGVIKKLVAYIVIAALYYMCLVHCSSNFQFILGFVAIGVLQWALLGTTSTTAIEALEGNYSTRESLVPSLCMIAWTGLSVPLPILLEPWTSELAVLCIFGSMEAMLIAVAAALLEQH